MPERSGMDPGSAPLERLVRDDGALHPVEERLFKPLSLEGRGEEQAAFGPELVLATLELQLRAHADGALVALAVVPDLLDRVVHPVVRQPHHGAETALGAEQTTHFGVL